MGEWTAARKAGFLDHLAATCNITDAAAAVGARPESVYSLRRRDGAFAAAWTEALAAGYEMLETRLVGHALAGGGQSITNGTTPTIGAIDRDVAMWLLNFRQAELLGTPRRRGGRPRRVASAEETDAAILKKLAAIARKKDAAA